MESETLILILVVIGVIVFRVIPNLKSNADGEFKVGDYGALGGIVCPNCDLPYAKKLGSINLGIGSLNRCPHCQKWRVARRASPNALAEAEARMGGQESAGEKKPEMSEEEKLRRDLDSSRFEE